MRIVKGSSFATWTKRLQGKSSGSNRRDSPKNKNKKSGTLSPPSSPSSSKQSASGRRERSSIQNEDTDERTETAGKRSTTTWAEVEQRVDAIEERLDNSEQRSDVSTRNDDLQIFDSDDASEAAAASPAAPGGTTADDELVDVESRSDDEGEVAAAASGTDSVKTPEAFETPMEMPEMPETEEPAPAAAAGLEESSSLSHSSTTKDSRLGPASASSADQMENHQEGIGQAPIGETTQVQANVPVYVDSSEDDDSLRAIGSGDAPKEAPAGKQATDATKLPHQEPEHHQQQDPEAAQSQDIEEKISFLRGKRSTSSLASASVAMSKSSAGGSRGDAPEGLEALLVANVEDVDETSAQHKPTDAPSIADQDPMVLARGSSSSSVDGQRQDPAGNYPSPAIRINIDDDVFGDALEPKASSEGQTGRGQEIPVQQADIRGDDDVSISGSEAIKDKSVERTERNQVGVQVETEPRRSSAYLQAPDSPVGSRDSDDSLKVDERKQSLTPVIRFPKPKIKSWARMKRPKKIEKSKGDEFSANALSESVAANSEELSKMKMKNRMRQEKRAIGRVKLKPKSKNSLAGVGEIISSTSSPTDLSVQTKSSNKKSQTTNALRKTSEVREAIFQGAAAQLKLDDVDPRDFELSEMILWSDDTQDDTGVEIVSPKADGSAATPTPPLSHAPAATVRTSSRAHRPAQKRQGASRDVEDESHIFSGSEGGKTLPVVNSRAEFATSASGETAEKSRRSKKSESRRRRDKKEKKGKSKDRRREKTAKHEKPRKREKRNKKSLASSSSDISDVIEQFTCPEVAEDNPVLCNAIADAEDEDAGCRDVTYELRDMAIELITKGPKVVVKWLE